jgi:gamma-glutamyltranspeptidase/glutathione hydrolase
MVLLVAALGCATGPSATPAAGSPAAAASRHDHAAAYATGLHGAVTSAEATASAIGQAVLERGGNAVDAAVAVAFALGVTYPSAANIGGGGFMLVRLPDGRADAIDYREVAPAAARADMYLDAQGNLTDAGQAGPLSAGIPGVVAGLALAHERWGSRSWAELCAPAIALAREGARLDAFQARDLSRALELTREFAASRAARASVPRAVTAETQALDAALAAMLATFGKSDGQAHVTGDLWRQPALAKTLEQIAARGARAFYEGPLAERMAAGVRAMGGIWSADDLARYHAVERQPIAFSYHGYEVLTMPPPSGGGIVLRQILGAADLLGLHRLDWDSSERVHLYIEILRRTYADRNRWLGDPDFVQIPLAELLDPARIARRVADIDPERATPSSEVTSGAVGRIEPNHTTHFSIVDASGMAVSNTFTLNGDFGALVQIPGTGVTLNNEMDDFTAKPGEPNMAGLVQGEQNAIAPGKRMLSSMSPTIVSREGALRAVLGSPGGPTITTTVAQILMQLLDHGRSLQRAVASPRIHNQWLPDETWYEAGVPEPTLERLRGLGHHLTLEREPIGHAHCIERDPISGELRAVADVPRGGGGAVAY